MNGRPVFKDDAVGGEIWRKLINREPGRALSLVLEALHEQPIEPAVVGFDPKRNVRSQRPLEPRNDLARSLVAQIATVACVRSKKSSP